MRALRAIWFTLGKEFRLIRRDRIGLFMLLVAPIAVIAAAGFSLARVFGGDTGERGEYTIAIVDEDHGLISHTIFNAIARDQSVNLMHVDTRADAEASVRERKQAVVAIVIPAGTTRTVAGGGKARLILYTDPVKYLQTVRIELMVSEMCREINAGAIEKVRRGATQQAQYIHDEFAAAQAAAEKAHAEANRLAAASLASREVIAAHIRERIEKELNAARDHAKAAIDAEFDRIKADLNTQAAAQRARLDQLKDYLQRLKVSQTEFEAWFAQLKEIAGSRASSLPPPPSIPAAPANLDLTDLKIESPDAQLKTAQRNLEASLTVPRIEINARDFPLPKIPNIAIPSMGKMNANLAIPGTLGFTEFDLNGKETAAASGFNAFDLQVPGFAVTFLMIGMLMGVSLALIDERDWGTLERLRSVSAPLWTTLTGKLLARFVVGFVQMMVLFGAGWLLFGISLGHMPEALMLPAAAIAFAGAAFGLIVAGVGRTRDAVMPVGAIVIMTMAAIGGCWWPIDLEPAWMQQVALGLPTTWAMRAFNDLMIRDLSVTSALMPTAINFGFGLIYTVIGVAIARRRFG
ncbi:MAG: ABC transporter permease [Candidatus Binatus sp.]|uniref:ABC transporter permease n=1 Tax=Candidatus Binatus sp. TaxID=2811406 RepID=UPI00271E512A|nr:ABC transporter permease [Candidatus Binatus sp.]MDO8433118.1 ABC transporter permease [Candidatus Binatus sp.]